MASRKNKTQPTEESADESTSLLGLEAEDGSEGDTVESASASVQGFKDEDDDFDVPARDVDAPTGEDDDLAVPARELDEAPADDGLTAKDREEYRKAYKKEKDSKEVVLAKEAEKTPSGKTLWVLQNISCKVGGQRKVLEPGKPLPKGVLGKGTIAKLLDSGALSAVKPKKKAERQSLLGLT